MQVHLSTQLPAGLWTVEVRRDGEAFLLAEAGTSIALAGGGCVRLLAPYSPGPGGNGVRLWVSLLDTPEPLHTYLARHGRPIRYGYVQGSFPIAAYQNVYVTEPGSAEMPSAGRPFTPEVLTRLVAKGVGIAPLLLHTGVASLEANEPPYAEYFRVTSATAHRVNDTRRRGGRVVAIGTTVVRALESVVDEHGRVHPARRLDPDGGLPGPPGALHRRLPDRLARARGIASGHARGHRRPADPRGLLRRRARRGLPVARVRRRPSDPAVTAASDPAVTQSPLSTLPTTRRAILNLLKREGPLTATRWPDALALTPAAIRMQLVHLEEDGLLSREESAADGGRRGRPSHTYTLTAAAEALYPKRYGDLTTELLGYLGGPDGEQVDALFEQRRQRRVDGARPRLAHLSFDEQVAALAAILDEDGYLADAARQEDGSWLITEHNCAILTVAHGFSQACSSELSFIRDAPARGAHGGSSGWPTSRWTGAHVCACTGASTPAEATRRSRTTAPAR